MNIFAANYLLTMVSALSLAYISNASIIDSQTMDADDRPAVRKARLDSNVVLIGRWAQGPCYASAVSGDVAYLGNGAYLDIVDFLIQPNLRLSADSSHHQSSRA